MKRLLNASETRSIKEAATEMAVLEENSSTKLLYAVAYRLSTECDESTAGDYAYRRAHLIARLRALTNPRSHVSTSFWTVESGQGETGLADTLAQALDLEWDLLRVVRIPHQPVARGPSRLALANRAAAKRGVAKI